MAEEVNLSDSVAQAAQTPKVIAVAGMGSSEDHPLPDQIAAAKFMPLSATRKRVGAGIKFNIARAGGATR